VANNWFTAYGLPQTRSTLSSSEVRGEFNRISAAFDRMPEPTSGSSPKGFLGAYLESSTFQNGAWLGGVIGTVGTPVSDVMAGRFRFGFGTGYTVSDAQSGAARDASIFRVATTDRIAFGKNIDNVTPKVSFFMDEKASLVMGDATTEAATTTTTGFFYLPTVNGAPTGVPAAYTGAVAALFDRSTNRIYVRNGATWRYVALT